MAIDNSAFRKFSYGLFILTARSGSRDNGCIINTAMQLNASQITVAVNKQNLTHDMIRDTGLFNVSVLTEAAPFDLFRHFGFQSGRETDKFPEPILEQRAENGLLYLPQYTCAMFSGKVIQMVDAGSHTLFLADVTEAQTMAGAAAPITYSYYFSHVKPKPEPKTTGWVCTICGYVHPGETLPPDFVCPICKHPAADFAPVK